MIIAYESKVKWLVVMLVCCSFFFFLLLTLVGLRKREGGQLLLVCRSTGRRFSASILLHIQDPIKVFPDLHSMLNTDLICLCVAQTFIDPQKEH